MKAKRVRIRIQTLDQVKAEWSAALKGKLKQPHAPDGGEIVFTSLAAMAKMLSPARLELLGVIVREKPASIAALAKRVKRDFKNVHTDTQMLASVGLIDLVPEGPRSAVRPVARYRRIELDLDAA